MEKDDKKIEDLVNKLMATDQLEKAPLNFTEKVIDKIEGLSGSTSIVYKPLIPKYVWWLLAIGFVALIGRILFKSPSDSVSLSERYNLPDISFNLLENMSFNFSSTLMYAVVLFAVMISIQIPLFKQYFNSRLSY